MYGLMTDRTQKVCAWHVCISFEAVGRAANRSLEWCGIAVMGYSSLGALCV